MSDIQTETVSVDHHIREQAYYSWEAAGRPMGRDLEHWDQAKHLLSGTTKALVTDLASMAYNYEGGISAQPPSTAQARG